ncbi:MAG TPA: glutamate-1-semialdehyde-2,1-aminomutase [Flavobacteriales bacterium]|nr:glutamate-1-semialdehyde-2,1-aminomutase [Flavobacteriales bacterium]|tara:strand:- start:3365 stop:4648 length:1284 start_codon:yes stop_codon:yes gene_type:complete
MKLDKSKQLYQRGNKHLVGAVNSPVRAFGSVGGNPVFMDHADGSKIYDVDGNEYIDLVGSYGPMILGHNHPIVLDAVKEAIEKGFTFGASALGEIELAELIYENFSGIDKIRFVNSGTEAVLSAIRLARAFTGRNKIIKFSGCYHGHSDALLVAAGSGVVTFSLPGSAGVPEAAVKDTLIANYNDLQSVKHHFDEFPNDIAAIFIEPVAGNMGVVLPEKEFLQQLKELAHANGALLVIDEVMTGFRSTFGGAQHKLGVTADITCMGKVIGGGFPVGAYAAREEIMNRVAPVGDVYQAGTLSGNPVAMAVGKATLETLKAINPYDDFEKKAQVIEDTLLSAAKEKGIPLTVNRFGSMINPFFTDKKVTNFDDAKSCDTELFAKFFWNVMENGVYIPPSQFEAWFLNTAITGLDMEKLQEALRNSIKEL